MIIENEMHQIWCISHKFPSFADSTTGCYQGLIANKNIRRWVSSGDIFAISPMAASYIRLRRAKLAAPAKLAIAS